MSNVEKAEEEIAIANKASSAYHGFIKDFIELRRVYLFDAFQTLEVTDQDNLIEVKRMLYTLDALETDIRNIMDTGKMARELLRNIE